jgi:hypothetical protein
MSKAEKHFPTFSPFPPAMIWEKRNRALLIQFLAAELISSHRGCSRHIPAREILSAEKRFFPYDWAYPYGHLNKAREYAMVLEYTFPELEGPAIQFLQLMNKIAAYSSLKTSSIMTKCAKSLPGLFLALEPFVEACKENENLIFFLLKGKEDIDQCLQKKYVHSLLLKLHPGGLSELCEKLCDNYHHRGFYFLIPEIKLLMAQFTA